MTEQYTPPAPQGAPVPPPGQVQPEQKKGFAITALVIGIVAILGSWIPFLGLGSVFLGLIGLVFGVIAIIKAVKGTAGGKVMAIVGAALSALAMIIGVASTAAGVAAVDSAFDELEGDISAAVEDAATDTSSEDTAADSTEGTTEEAEAETDAVVVGSFDNPGAVGDGTVWTVESTGDEWEITFDSIEVMAGYDGEIAVVLGTATPTVIADGATSTWISFPTIQMMAEGAMIDDTFDFLTGDEIGDEYRSVVDLEATAGTEMKFYSTVGLPEGVTPEFVVVETLFGSDEIYLETGL